MLNLLAELQTTHSREVPLEETLREISSLQECKMEEDIEADEEEEGGVEEEDSEEGERLIKEEMEFSDNGVIDIPFFIIFMILKPLNWSTSF